MNHPAHGRSLTGIGNLITVGLQLYRLRFRAYVLQSLVAGLWLLIPIWGWAEFFAISTTIAHTAYHDLIDDPRAIADLKRPIQRKKWHLLLMNIWVISRIVASLLIATLVLGFLIALIELTLDIPGYMESTNGDSPAELAIGFVALGCWYLIGGWMYQSDWLAEIAAATDQDFKPFAALKRSRALTRHAPRLSWSLLFLVQIGTFFGSFLLAYLSTILIAIALRFLPLAPDLKITIAFIIWGGLSLLTAVLTFPFWQTIKATLFYFLRNQQEGTDLTLRSPP